jgi:thiamine biosynthesis protein ThiI
MKECPKESLYLLKPGELALKGGNRGAFEGILRRNLSAMLRGTGARMIQTQGRLFVRASPDKEGAVEEALDRLIGISGWAKARSCEKTVEAVLGCCADEGRRLYEEGGRSFKIEARRTDKSFPLSSYEICCRGGAAVEAAVPGIRVDVRRPEGIIEVEIRERAYVYGRERRGRRGLPVGSAGRGLLLLSGGIDSPVAGYLMATRGMRLEGIYFHAYPFTSQGAREKAVRLGEIIGRYSLGLRLHIVPFTPVQLRIREGAPEAWRTILLRMAMLECAETLARRRGDRSLITGESLSQVASQTIENLSCIGNRITLPILRPLIGLDKEEIIGRACAIGSYEVSILPYEDCCVLFSPPHPVLRGRAAEGNPLYETLELGPLIEEALGEAEIERCGFPPQG